MSKQIQLRRGNISSFSAFTGAAGEPTFVSDRSTLRVHDGSTAGGIELARNGYLSKSVAGSSNVTLTEAEAARPFLEFTGILTGNIQVIFPITLNSGKLYLIKNSTTGSFTLTVIGTSGTGVVLPQSGVGLFSHDGTNMVSSGGVGSIGYFPDGTSSAPSISFSADTNTGIYRVGIDNIGISTGGANAISIDSIQNVGIGVLVPGYRLDVQNTAVQVARFKNTSSPSGCTVLFKVSDDTGLNITCYGPTYSAGSLFSVGAGGSVLASDSTANFVIGTTSATHLILGTSGTEKARVTTTGNLLIGTTSETGLTGAGGLRIGSTTEATTGGAGSAILLGGLYVTKAIISGSITDSTNTTSGSFITAGGAAIAKTLTTAGRILSTSIKTTTYTITTSDSVIVCNSSSAFTVSLPSLASASTGRQYIIKNKGAGQITLTASGSETIDGSVSVYINQYESLTIVSDGATWNVI